MILKICGITNQDDASAAIEAGASAIGFNFYPRSPRYVSPERAAGIGSGDGVRRVGVFVNESPARVAEIAALARLDVAQLHGDETPAEYPAVDPSVDAARRSACATAAALAVWKAVRVGENFDIALYHNDPAEALLLDGPAGEAFGGAGRSFDWRLVGQTNHKIVVAGGLDASNVALAIARVRPWGVDACSRIESAPGKKDHKKMKEFLHAALLAAAV